MKTFYKRQNGFAFARITVFFFLLLAFTACSKKDDPTTPPAGNNELEFISFTPSHALPGATITLTGKHFSTVKQDNHVRFQGTATDATVLTATTTELSVVVPATAITGKINITIGTKTVTSATDFVVDQVAVTSITDFIPKQGPFGTVVTLTGQNFGNNIRVSLNNIEAQVTQKSATQIVFTIPSNTTLTAHKIRVESDGTPLETVDNFTVTNTGSLAQWVRKNVNPAPSGIFQFGLSFVHRNKIYWGFSKLSALQTHTDYMVLDITATNPQWVMGNPPPADMAPASLQSAVAVVHNDRVYIGTGLAPTSSNAWWEYNPETNTSTRLANYPENTAHALAFSYAGKIYAGFGGASKKLHEYNPATNTWTFVTNTDMQDVNDASAFVIGNEAFIGRGLATVGGERKEFMRFGGTWLTAVTALPENIQSPETPSFTFRNKGYFVTGQKVWEYTPNAAGGNWRLVISTTTGPSIRHTALVVSNGVPVVYGWTSTGELFEFRIS